MNKILETKRLILREFDITDASGFYELSQDRTVMEYTGDIAFRSVEEAGRIYTGLSGL